MRLNMRESKIGVAVGVGAFLLSSGAWAAESAVKAVRVGEHPGKTRVVLDLTGPAQAQTSVSPDGRTLMIDLPGTAWKAAARQNIGKSPLLTGFESSASPDGGSRLILSAKAPISVAQSLNLKPDSSGGHRLVFDLAAGAAPAAVPALVVPVQPAAAPAAESADVKGVYAAPHISTLGFGHDFGYRVNEMAGVRISGNYFRLSRNTDIDGVNYKAEGELKSVGALADLYPFGGGFHVTGGVYLNMNEGKLTGTPTTSVTIGDNVYTAAQVGTLSGVAEFNRVAPYLGVGWKGTALSPNLMFGADLGVMYQGDAKVSLSSNGTASSTAYATDLERERKNIEDELSKYRFFPVATVSVGYKF